ncbi:MAG: ABC transporter permease [Clostridia bacterium]|nr:ABC transporter permease [Clostridia bacterium]
MKRVRNLLQAYGTLLALVMIILVFSILRPKSFFTLRNFINISRQISLMVIISIGATMVMSINEFDLSVGTMASLGGVMAAQMAVAGLPLPLCFLLPMLIALVIGWINGWIVARFRVLSFITTLGMSTVLSGLIYRLTGGATVFQNIPRGFSFLGTYKLGEIPLLSLIMVAFVVLFSLIMRHTVLGRRFYAIGGSEETAKVSGINVPLYKNIAFALCALLSCITGMLIASRVGSANTTAGDGYFLSSYAAVFIGCTVSRKGIPNVPGTLVGCAILGILTNGLTMLQMPTYLQDMITGSIIILAVILQKVGRGDAR